MNSWLVILLVCGGALHAGLSGQVRLPSGEGLAGVSIGLRGKPGLSTTSGQDGRWSLGTGEVGARRDRILRQHGLRLLDGRLRLDLEGFTPDGRSASGPASGALAMGAARSLAVVDTLVLSLCAARTSVPLGSMDSGAIVVVLDTVGALRGCDAAMPSIPQLGFPTSWGDVTTYGGVDTTAISSGGACNYGITGIRFYAAIQVDLAMGDAAGQWRQGRACGQGARVRAHTAQGVKETFVRIMDKCPDPHCGIDLGGAPAAAIMGPQPGRYQGEWTFESCKGHPELFDGPTHLWTKEGSSAFWSLIQVRNPWTAVASLRWRSAKNPAGTWSEMSWATEAENFFKVPTEFFAGEDSVDLGVLYVDSTSHSVRLLPTDLAKPRASYVLP
ncbi:MAG TPA: expansin-like protein [Fibrobacteria bacterium]|nr:expansin-like protein [Fibrobacteria bacterium]